MYLQLAVISLSKGLEQSEQALSLCFGLVTLFYWWCGFFFLFTQVIQVIGIQLVGSSFSLCWSVSLEEILFLGKSLVVPLCSRESWPTDLL